MTKSSEHKIYYINKTSLKLKKALIKMKKL